MENVTSETVRPVPARSRIVPWIGPAFLVALVAIFVFAPWSFKGKLDAVCYGI